MDTTSLSFATIFFTLSLQPSRITDLFGIIMRADRDPSFHSGGVYGGPKDTLTYGNRESGCWKSTVNKWKVMTVLGVWILAETGK